jgi:hypothetical protein
MKRADRWQLKQPEGQNDERLRRRYVRLLRRKRRIEAVLDQIERLLKREEERQPDTLPVIRF